MVPFFSPPDDVLVIGSGVGGLSTAIILSKLGFHATVIEKNPLPGGLMRSYPRYGIECPVGVHYLGSLGKGQVLRRFFDYLEVTSMIPVERMGGGGIVDKYIFNDFTFDFPDGFEAFQEALRTTFPDQQGQISAFTKALMFAATQMDTLDFLFSTQNALGLLEQANPFGEFLTNLNCSVRLRSVLSVPSSWSGVPSEECPTYYHNMILASYLCSSWRLTCSGAHMADAFSFRLKALGGELIQGDKVENILVNSRAVQGVQLKSGRIIRAPIVVGAIHPKIILNMLPKGPIRPIYRRRIANQKDTHGILSVHAEVDASCHKEIPYNIFRVYTDKRGHIDNIVFCQLRRTEKAGKNILSLLTSDKPELWRKWENTSTGSRGPDYIAAKTRKAWDLIHSAEDIFGTLQGTQLLDVFTSLTVRDWVTSPGGSAYGVLRSSEQLRSAAMLNRPLMKGLILAGQSVIAPGIMGTIMGSLNAVKQIIGPDRFKEAIRL